MKVWFLTLFALLISTLLFAKTECDKPYQKMMTGLVNGNEFQALMQKQVDLSFLKMARAGLKLRDDKKLDQLIKDNGLNPFSSQLNTFVEYLKDTDHKTSPDNNFIKTIEGIKKYQEKVKDNSEFQISDTDIYVWKKLMSYSGRESVRGNTQVSDGVHYEKLFQRLRDVFSQRDFSGDIKVGNAKIKKVSKDYEQAKRAFLKNANSKITNFKKKYQKICNPEFSGDGFFCVSENCLGRYLYQISPESFELTEFINNIGDIKFDLNKRYFNPLQPISVLALKINPIKSCIKKGDGFEVQLDVDRLPMTPSGKVHQKEVKHYSLWYPDDGNCSKKQWQSKDASVYQNYLKKDDTGKIVVNFKDKASAALCNNWSNNPIALDLSSCPDDQVSASQGVSLTTAPVVTVPSAKDDATEAAQIITEIVSDDGEIASVAEGTQPKSDDIAIDGEKSIKYKKMKSDDDNEFKVKIFTAINDEKSKKSLCNLNVNCYDFKDKCSEEEKDDGSIILTVEKQSTDFTVDVSCEDEQENLDSISITVPAKGKKKSDDKEKAKDKKDKKDIEKKHSAQPLPMGPQLQQVPGRGMMYIQKGIQ